MVNFVLCCCIVVDWLIGSLVVIFGIDIDSISDIDRPTEKDFTIASLLLHKSTYAH